MPLRTYYAVLTREPGDARLSILFPQFPEIATSSEGFTDAMDVARDALATAVEGRQQDGIALPPSQEEEAEPPTLDLAEYHDPKVWTVTADVPGRAQRISVTMEEGLLGNLDAVAQRQNRTRSALLADGARLGIAQARAVA